MVCRRAECVCDCNACGKLFRRVTHGKVCDGPVHRPKLSAYLKTVYGLLEDMGVVPEGTSKTVSGISLRAGGVTVAAAQGITREILSGHGRWKSVSGPEHYDRCDLSKFAGVSNALQQALRPQKPRSHTGMRSSGLGVSWGVQDREKQLNPEM